MFKKWALVVLLLISVKMEIVSFDNSAVETIFQNKKDALFLFISDNEQSTKAHDAFKEFDQTNPEDVILTVSSKDDGHGLFERLAEYLGVDAKVSPQVLFYNSNAAKFRYGQQEITKDNLVSFIEKVKAGDLKPFFKSAPVPQKNDDAVKVVVGSTFESTILESEKQFMVEFYAPWCGHCKSLAPLYEKAAKILKQNPNIQLVKVDSTENQVAGVQIQGFPTLKFWARDKTVAPIDYDGERSTEGILSWIKQHTSYEWVDVAQQDQKQSEEEEQKQPIEQEL